MDYSRKNFGRKLANGLRDALKELQDYRDKALVYDDEIDYLYLIKTGDDSTIRSMERQKEGIKESCRKYV
jgi:hypothetical protein